MSTAQPGLTRTRHRSDSREVAAADPRVRAATRSSLATAGLLALLISAWGAIIPFAGPAFGYRATRGGSWQWTNARGLLAVAPGVVGILVGLLILTAVRRTAAVGRGRPTLLLLGLIAVAAGAWFVIGPLAWPVISNEGRYFVVASPWRNFLNQVGYALGPGLILAACGSFAMGWGARHQRTALLGAGEVEMAEATGGGYVAGRTARPVAEEGDVARPPAVAREEAPTTQGPAVREPVRQGSADYGRTAQEPVMEPGPGDATYQSQAAYENEPAYSGERGYQQDAGYGAQRGASERDSGNLRERTYEGDQGDPSEGSYGRDQVDQAAPSTRRDSFRDDRADQATPAEGQQARPRQTLGERIRRWL